MPNGHFDSNQNPVSGNSSNILPTTITPEAQTIAQKTKRHNFWGRLFENLAGGPNIDYQVNPQTGQMQAIKLPTKPGDLARRMIAGALTGLTAGLSSGTESEVRGGLPHRRSGFAAGFEAVQKQQQQETEQKQAVAEVGFKNLEQIQRMALAQQESLRQTKRYEILNHLSSIDIQKAQLGMKALDLELAQRAIDLVNQDNLRRAKNEKPVTDANGKELEFASVREANAYVSSHPDILHNNAKDKTPFGVEYAMGPDNQIRLWVSSVADITGENSSVVKVPKTDDAPYGLRVLTTDEIEKQGIKPENILTSPKTPSVASASLDKILLQQTMVENRKRTEAEIRERDATRTLRQFQTLKVKSDSEFGSDITTWSTKALDKQGSILQNKIRVEHVLLDAQKQMLNEARMSEDSKAIKEATDAYQQTAQQLQKDTTDLNEILNLVPNAKYTAQRTQAIISNLQKTGRLTANSTAQDVGQAVLSVVNSDPQFRQNPVAGQAMRDYINYTFKLQPAATPTGATLSPEEQKKMEELGNNQALVKSNNDYYRIPLAKLAYFQKMKPNAVILGIKPLPINNEIPAGKIRVKGPEGTSMADMTEDIDATDLDNYTDSGWTAIGQGPTIQQNLIPSVESPSKKAAKVQGP